VVSKTLKCGHTCHGNRSRFLERQVAGLRRYDLCRHRDELREAAVPVVQEVGIHLVSRLVLGDAAPDRVHLSRDVDAEDRMLRA
jgi:hypothetical protein